MKRRWFRIHLSTALVLMFVTGFCLWKNFQQVDGFDFRTEWPEGEVRYAVIGWPRHFAERFWQPSMVVHGANGVSTLVDYDTGWTWNLTGTDGPRALAFDALIVVGLNLMAVIVIEYSIRRREARTP